MRDKNVIAENYFKQLIFEKEELITKSLEGLEKGLYPDDNINLVKHRIFVKSIEKLVGMYSMGIQIEELKKQYFKTLSFMTNGGWDSYLVKFKKGRPEVIYDQYKLNEYCYMLWMLSLAELLGISQKQKNSLYSFIERDNITDELILGVSRINIKNISSTTYKPFVNLLKNDITIANVDKGIIKKYLTSWYKNTKLLQWHRYKSSIESSRYYYGYWSFESAVIVAINNLDDSSFENNEFYPKDLVDYYRMTVKK